MTKEKQKIKETEEDEEDEEIYEETMMKFVLNEDERYYIQCVGKSWKNRDGEETCCPEVFFLHKQTNQECESVKQCFEGWSEQSNEDNEKWDMLCERINALANVEEYVFTEENIVLY